MNIGLRQLEIKINYEHQL